MPRMRPFVLALLASFATATLHAQTHPHYVLTELPGNPATQVLEVDPVSGSWQPIVGLLSDNLPPLAMAQDLIDGALLVALWEPTGNTRIVRLHRFGGVFLEFPMVTVPGLVVDLAVCSDSLLIAVDAASGGVYRAPRCGGPATLVWSQPNLTAMNVLGYDGLVLAWTGRPGTSAVV